MQRRVILTLALCCLGLLSGCLTGSGERALLSFWKGMPLLEDDLSVSEDRIADFAELAVSAPEKTALKALDRLFDRLREDEVAYYVYTEWMDGVFYNSLSPCRNNALYSHAVDRIVRDGVLSEEEYAPYLRHKEWMGFNQAGAPAVVPGVSLTGERTLVLVLDLSCPSCRDALTGLAEDPSWAGLRHIAVACGHGPAPTVPGWEYVYPEHAAAVFDLRMTPVYFVISSTGTVEQTYTPAL